MSTPVSEEGKARWIVTVTQTIMDGTVVRWHRTLALAEAVEPTVSASRHMVSIRFADLRDEASIEDFEAVLRKARDVCWELRQGATYKDMERLATHRFRDFMGPLVLVGGV